MIASSIIYVDFSHLARRAFHVMSPGELMADNLVFYIFRMLKRIQDIYPRSELVCVFDGKNATSLIRKHVYTAYKQSRLNISSVTSSLLKQVLYPQIDFMYENLGCLGIICMKSNIFEADVVIASQVSRLRTRLNYLPNDNLLDKYVVVSGDKDFAPMVRGQVAWLRPRTVGRIANVLVAQDSQMVEEEFGVVPRLLPFAKVLIGDSSDFVKGVPGYGPVKSVYVLKEVLFKTKPTTKMQCLRNLYDEVIRRKKSSMDAGSFGDFYSKFLLFDTSCPKLLVDYVFSRLNSVSQSDLLSVKKSTPSSRKFRNLCKSRNFKSILANLEEWDASFRLDVL